MIIEIYKKTLSEKHGGNVKSAIAAEDFTAWTPERIKGAFAFGNGTEADLQKYMDANKKTLVFANI